MFSSMPCPYAYFNLASRLAPRPTQPPIKWVPGAPSPGTKRQGYEANHSPPSSAQVKNGGAILPLPDTSSWRDA
jgi:hypothetical protein